MLAALALFIRITGQEPRTEIYEPTTTVALRSQPRSWLGTEVRVCGTVQYGAKNDRAIIWNERVDPGSEQSDPNKSVSAVYLRIKADVRKLAGNVCVTGLFERIDGLTKTQADAQGRFVETPAEIGLDDAYQIITDSMTAAD